MPRKATGWTCRKQSCKFKNPPRTRKCQACGKARPAKKVVAHKRVLQEMTYEDFVTINGGDFCWICVRLPEAERVNSPRNKDRDHDHKTGLPRGLLCHKHNRFLASWVTLDLARAVVAYLEHAEQVRIDMSNG